MLKKLLTLFCALMVIGSASAQSAWADVSPNSLPAGERRIQPSRFRAIRMDLSALQNTLSAAPERYAPTAESANLPIISIPTPDGGTARFELEETPLMHPSLQAKYPQIRTYTGRGLDDPTAILKCDLTPSGFHGMILSGISSSIFIDPAVWGNTEYYVVYDRKDYQATKGEKAWTCGVPDADFNPDLGLGQEITPGQVTNFQGDTQLRRYRLALACTGEYAQYFGGTKAAALAAMNITMNRVNGVYERDFAVTMQIIANDDLLIFLNAGTDPYTNTDAAAMLSQNQTTCNNVIGVANYDIGHVFGQGDTGGIAGDIGVVCGTIKAEGVTGNSNPVGDPFDIDYVVHEMGHQFGGNHTFNHCGGFNSQISAVEPGSGTTIMAYAGICGADDVALHSEDIFHGYNIVEMAGYIYSGIGNTCPVKIPSTNHNPTVDAGPNRTIPKSTPFALTATGADIDGDTLTYTWEQIDPGNAASPPTPTTAVGPLFRSYKGGTSPTRIFPRLQDLVANINPQWEELPGVARTMNFRVTARDNDWYAGCTDEDDMQITVASTAGPFVVTAPNTNISWPVGSTQAVTWNVANTTAAPVSCANVRITLSTDGGFTYPIELAASVPNNGTANVTVPNNVSNTCRVRVESVGNIFFDISNVNFRIELPSAPTYLLDVSATSIEVCAGETASLTANLTALLGYSTDVTLSVSGAPAGATVNIAPNPVPPTGTATVSISDVTAAMAGTYTLTVSGVSGAITRTAAVTLNVYPGAPGLAAVSSPADGETGVGLTANLSWANAAYATAYVVEVATNPSFSPGSIISIQNTSSNSATVAGLQVETVYYWHVQANNNCGDGVFSPTWAFQTGKNLCNQNFTSTDVPKTIPVAATVPPVLTTLNVATSKPINDVNLSVAFTHTWVGDLSAWLVSPSGDSVSLFDQPGVPASTYGCDGQNGNLTFDSQAAQSSSVLENQCNGTPPALSGSFQSIASLSAVTGKNASGQWKLYFGDNYPSGDGGSITSWSLSFCFPDAIAAGNILTNNPLVVLTGQSEAILQSLLDVQISGVPGQAVYVLMSLPQHGTLTLNGTPLSIGSTFTQEDINNNVLEYTNNGDGAVTDAFIFDVVDQNNDAWVHNTTFNINIEANNLAASASETASIACHGDASGQITVAASGLDGNYTYSLNGGASQSSNVFSGLAAGTYTVVVTGQFGFTASANSVTLSEPGAISASTSVSTDDVTVTATGGTGAYEYSIDGTNFQSSNEFLDLPNGIYTVTVRDENGCTTTSEAIVAVNTLLVSLNVQGTVKCAGESNGELIVTIGGGEAPYTYSLNGGAAQNSNIFSNLPAGSYTVVVTDNVGFSATSNGIVLNDPAELLIAASAVLNVVTVTASGGTGNLEYSVDGVNFQGSNEFVNLPNGTYTVTVRDENGCSKTTEVTVFVTPLSGSLQAAPILCAGGTTTIFVNAFNGIQPYEYRLGNGPFQNDNSFTGVVAGTYTASVRDASGTILQVGPIIITEPDPLNVSVAVFLNDASIGFVGGTAPYTFTTDAPNSDLQNLPNGTYHVTATDSHGCTATTSFTINVPALTLSSTVSTVSCNGAADGSITAQGTGGIPPYTFSLNGGLFQTDNEFNNLAAGSYTLTIKDAEGNTTTSQVVVSQPNALQVTGQVSSNTITATATGGTQPYKFSLNGGAFQNSGVFSGLASGTYTVVVEDNNGCTASITNLIVTSGTVEPADAWGLAVSPNPGTGLFVLTMQNAPAALLAQVYDATGRLLKSMDLNPSGGKVNAVIDLQEFPQGTYMLRLTDGQNWGGVRLSKVGN